MITPEISDSPEKILPILKKHSVELVAIGGIAVHHYGHQRISGGPVQGDIKADLDFWYKPTNENYINLLRALKDMDVNTDDLEKIIFDPKKLS